MRAKHQKSTALTIVGSSGLELPTIHSGSSANPGSATAVGDTFILDPKLPVTGCPTATRPVQSRVSLEYG